MMKAKITATLARMIVAILFCTTARAEPNVEAVLTEVEQSAAKLGKQQSGFLYDLAKVETACGDRPKAKELLQRVVQLTSTIQHKNDKEAREARFFLTVVAEAQAQVGDFAGAVETVQAIGDSSQDGYALMRIAAVQAEVGDFRAALATCDRIDAKSGHWKAAALDAVAAAQASAGNFDAALKTAGRIDMIPANGDAARELNLATKSLSLWQIATLQAKRGKVADSLQTAERITRKRLRSRALRDIARRQAEIGDKPGAKATLDEALRLARQLDDVDAIRAVAYTQVEVGDLGGAVHIASELLQGAAKGMAMLRISIGYLRAGKYAAATKAFDQGMAIIRTHGIEDDTYSLGEIAVDQARAGDTDRAMDIAGEIQDELGEAYALRLIVAEILKRDDFDRALEIADSIRGCAYQRASAFREIAMAQAKSKMPTAKNTFARAFQTAESMEIGGATDVIALYEVGRAEAKAGYVEPASKAFRQARRRALKYQGEAYVAGLFQGIAQAQTTGGDVQGALAAARSQSSEILKARSLLGVAQGLLECRGDPGK